MFCNGLLAGADEHQRILQAALFFNFSIILPFMASLRAMSKTSFTPRPAFAEHSAYRAPMRFATACPCSADTGRTPCAASMSSVRLSDRRSVFVPINKSGTFGQKCETSGCHCTRSTA